MSLFFNGIRFLSLRTSLPVALTAALLVTISGAQAQDFCTNIDYLIDQSQSAFSEIADKPTGDPGNHDATLTLDDASFCLVTRNSDRTWYHCGWELPHRAPRAYEMFDEFVEKLNDCIGQHATLHSDQNVNHPDYYSLRRFETERADVSVSVKDKGALGSTFVFIRVQGNTKKLD